MIDTTISTKAAEDFLALRRIAVVGASADERKFGNAVYRRLRDDGYDVVAVNPGEDVVAGDRCYRSIGEVPDGVEGAIVMTSADHSADAVAACIAAGVRHIWLFQGIGGTGSVTKEALRLCEANGVTTIAGACPFMFLEPVRGGHRVHRAIRHLRGAVA
jgi:predicted CoA-binding protein